ncbi:MAG TPA: hypothetical protein VFT72_04315 [Opitutaceae bacterium]|nr:hypothetical protein [Opitutaceae bacterium]
MTFRSSVPRFLVSVLLIAVALLAGGCVYLRLLELRNQLADFDKNFAVNTADGIHLIFRHPMLLGDDLRWLGAEPQEIQQRGDDEESWHVRWVKQTKPGVEESSEHDVELFAELRDHELQSLRIPERYFEFFPKSLFVDLLRSTGKAHINKESRQAEVSTADEVSTNNQPIAVPELDSIEKLLGEPTDKTTGPSGLVRYRYRYQAQIPSGKGKFIEATFFFDPASGQLRRLIGKLPKGTMSFNFPAAKDAGQKTGQK